jgi:hypothetical protein
MIANSRPFPLCHITPRRPAGSKQIIDEHHPMANKTFLSHTHQFAYKTMRLNLCPRPDNDIPLDLDKRTNKTILPDAAPIQIHRLYNLYAGAKADILNLGI